MGGKVGLGFTLITRVSGVLLQPVPLSVWNTNRLSVCVGVPKEMRVVSVVPPGGTSPSFGSGEDLKDQWNVVLGASATLYLSTVPPQTTVAPTIFEVMGLGLMMTGMLSTSPTQPVAVISRTVM